MITEQQKANLYKLSNQDLKTILHICIERLGVCDIKEACFALNVQRSRIYQLMKPGNFLQIGKHKFIMINELFKKHQKEVF